MSTLRYAKPHVGRRVEKTVELGDELLALFLFKALAINKNKIVINKKNFQTYICLIVYSLFISKSIAVSKP